MNVSIRSQFSQVDDQAELARLLIVHITCMFSSWSSFVDDKLSQN